MSNRLQISSGFLALLAVFLSAAAMPPITEAQTGAEGTITVTVVDQSGGVVEGAELTLQNLSTNDIRAAASQKAGTYSFVGLNVGSYKLSVAHSGFATEVFNTVSVHAGLVTDVRAALKVAPATETMVVSAEQAPLVESTSNVVGGIINLKQIENLPLGDRDLTQLTAFAPGYTAGTPGVSNGTFNGLPGAAQESSMDGVIAQTSRNRDGGVANPYNTVASPRVQNIQEMSIQTGQMDAEGGFGQGTMQVTFVTRSGTNHFHGSLFADLQNSSFNANSWENDFFGVPKALYHKNDFGGSVSGPILKDKLFFFFGLEKDNVPGQSQLSGLFLTPAMQQGNYTYVGTDGNVHTVNLFSVAGGTPDTTVAGEISKINNSLSSGTVTSVPGVPYNVEQVIFNEPNNLYWTYPTVRVDYNATRKLRLNFALNESKFSAPTTLAQTFPGSTFSYQTTGASSNGYTASVGADWTVSPTLINQFRGGYLYNSSVSAANQVGDPQKYKFIDFWNGQNRLSFGCSNFLPCSGDAFYSRINYFFPIINFGDNLTWQHGSHSAVFGVSFYREQDHYWNPPSGWAGLGLFLAGGDPASNVLQPTNPALSFASPSQVGEMQNFYAILAGHIGNMGGLHPLNSQTHTYDQYGSYNLDELQKAWGLYARDSWRVRPNLTVNYGLRWDFTGDDHDLQNLYYSPPLAGLFGVSGLNNLFNPGSEQGNPSNFNYIGRGHAYSPWNVSPQPNFGVAWNPQFTEGLLGKLTGGGKTVLRAGYALRRYTEQYQTFWNYASNFGSFFFQGFSASGVPSGVTGPGTFPAGTVTVSNFSNFNNWFLSPPSFSSQISEASQAYVGAGLNGMNPNVAQPYIQSWNIGLQRSIGSHNAIEIRYVGNRGIHEWLGLNTNEVNIFENGFLTQFKAAQSNLAICMANASCSANPSFGNQGLPGQVPLPIFDAAFQGEPGGPGTFGDYTAGQLITNLQLGQAGSMAATLASPFGIGANYLCNLVPTTSLTGQACAANLGYTGSGGTYPENLFQANPYYSSVGYLNSVGYSNYNALQVEFRQQPWHGMEFHGNYTFSKTLGVTQQYTLRDLRSGYGPANTDRRHVANILGTYDLPFGKGRTFLKSNNSLDRLVGGWTLGTIVTFTTGFPFQLPGGNQTFNNLFDGGLVLNGVTASQIQHAIGVYPLPCTGQCTGNVPGQMSWINPKFIAANGLPSGQIQPNTVPGSFGYRPWFYGMHHWSENMSISKAIAIRESVRLRLQGEALNIFNHPEWDIGSTFLQSNTFGSTSGPGGSRVIEVRANLEF